jgi:hypothetical protein
VKICSNGEYMWHFETVGKVEIFGNVSTCDICEMVGKVGIFEDWKSRVPFW